MRHCPLPIDFNGLALGPCIAAFGQAITYQPGAGAPLSLTGIFNAMAVEDKISPEGDMVQDIRPTLALNAANFPAGQALPVRGETVTINGTIYQISEPVADNFGQILLKLRRLTA